MVGTAAIVKLIELAPVPPGVVTLIGPVVTAGGAVAVMVVSLTTVNVAFVPLKRTADAPVNRIPEIVTVLPAPPRCGLKPVIDGGMPNGVVLVPEPAGVVTVTGPVVAPAGTTAVIEAGPFTVNEV